MMAMEESVSPLDHTARRMQLRYGFNEVDAWWHVALGEHREKIRRRLLRLRASRLLKVNPLPRANPDKLSRRCPHLRRRHRRSRR